MAWVMVRASSAQAPVCTSSMKPAYAVSMSGSSTGTRMSRSNTLIALSPMVQGMRGLTWAMTRPALAAAALTMSTETPRLQRPW